ncbi:myomegalin-like isoform X2 [Hyperolius riggenbachi]|uniref:myomegalin-like isoform X2 n=1 Tax=Hyperolius riggenbachi TaxID=752182 RepID=UPI0035A27E59
MLDLKMKDICRICGRELCGNQRRWIFHTAAKLNLQVVLSNVLGKEILRDGQAEFACSKCVFMLERFFRFDTVIARIEALSIERLQKLISEKDRLKHCLSSLYKKNNNEDGQEAKSGPAATDTSNLTDAQYSYSTLLQEDFAYSGFECWMELEEFSPGPQHCPHMESTAAVPRKCHCCSSLRVADSDYEAVCKVPRKISQNVSSGNFSTCGSTFSEQIMAPQTDCEAASVSMLDSEVLDRLSCEHSVESLPDTKEQLSHMQKDEEKNKLNIENPKCHCMSKTCVAGSFACGNKLDIALSLVKMLNYKPLQSPRGSKIPIKSKYSSSILTSADSSSSNTFIGFLENSVESPCKLSGDFIYELADFQDLWQNIYEDYIPLHTQNLIEKQSQDANLQEALLGQEASKLQKAEMEIHALQGKLQESQDTIKMLQEAQQQLTSKLTSSQESAHNQECMLQSLKETLQNKDQEVLELYQIIGDHNNTINKLQNMILKSQSEHLQSFQITPTQMEFLDLQNTLLSTQMELQKKHMALHQIERQLNDAKRSQQMLEVHLLEGQQQKETTWKHNQELHGALHKIQKELQEKSQHLKNVEEDNCTQLAAQEQSIQRLKDIVSKKEQMLQEYMEVLNYKQSLEKVPGGNEHMLEKLRHRIRERDAALEVAVDNKFRALEEKEREVHQLKKVIREREQDLERLNNVLSGNEETINSLDNLVKAKDLEMEQISAAYKNLQWSKQEVEEKYRCSLSEKESIMVQLQKSLQERNKVEVFAQSHAVHATPICMKNSDIKGEESEKTDNLKTELAKAQEDLRLVLRKMREYQLEVSALQSIIMKQNEQLRDQAADIDTLTRNSQIKEDLIKELQMNLVDREDIPTMELLTQEIFSLKMKMSSMDCSIQDQHHHNQKVFKLLEELIENKTRLNEVLQTERQLYSCLLKCRSDCDRLSVNSTLHSDLLLAQGLRDQLEDSLMRTIEQLVVLQSKTKAASGLGGASEKHIIEKNTYPFTETSINADVDDQRRHIQKLTKDHLINEEENVLEKLHSELSDAKISPSNIRNVQQKVCVQTVNLKVAEESVMSTKLVFKMEKKAQEERAPEFRILKDERKQNQDTERYSVEHNKGDCTFYSNCTIKTANEIGSKVKHPAGMGGQAKAGSLKRTCHRSSPLDEEKSKILKTGQESIDKFYKWQDASYSQTDSNANHYAMQMQSKPQNHDLLNTSNAPNFVMHTDTDSSLQDETEMKYDGSQMQVDFQDLGYETCGKSENEIDREETTSPEYEKEDMVNETNDWHQVPSNPPLGKNGIWQVKWNSDFMKSEDVTALQQLVKTLKTQLQKSQRLIQVLENKRSSSSHGSTSHSLTDEDEGWQSDTAEGHPYRLLKQLAERMSVLEMQVHQLQSTGTYCQTSSAKEFGKHDWLIQAQARELSVMRQRMEKGQSICQVLTQQLQETIKLFEEMLRANDIDFYMGKNFREHLTQGAQLVVGLYRNLSNRGCVEVNKNTNFEFPENRITKQDNQNGKIMENSESYVKGGSISSTISHSLCESDGTPSIIDDHFSVSDDLDNYSDVSETSGYSCCNKSKTKDKDVCCTSPSLDNSQRLQSEAIDRSYSMKNELYIIGHTDFHALKNHVSQGKALVEELETYIQSSLQIYPTEIHGMKVIEYGGIKKLLSTTKILHQILEKSNSLLSMFWTDSPNTQNNILQKKEEQAMQDEILTLRSSLKEKEMLLQKVSQQMKMSNLARQNMEKLVSQQLTNTCGILKKARLNLQPQVC